MQKTSENSFDQSYSEWKEWSWKPFSELTGSAKRYFTGEFNKLSFGGAGRLLELGFGEGEFMEWAKHEGHSVVGVELIDTLVENARKAGFKAEKLNLAQQTLEECEAYGLELGSFDAIIAFDVIEHMTSDELIHFLTIASKLLKPNGQILARVPNGGSAIGLRLQNGDQTHQLALTKSKLKQLLVGSDFKVHLCDNSFRVTGNGRFSFLFRIAFPVRNFIEYFLGGLYFMGRIPLDPALTAIFRKAK
ncbi:MAG TPA: hypothetical protein DCX06_10120 [Opitutae bacterium]|nr:hypothetical protein [Opitutae bacterium]